MDDEFGHIEPRNALENMKEAAASFRGTRQQHRYLEACAETLDDVITEWQQYTEADNDEDAENTG